MAQAVITKSIQLTKKYSNAIELVRSVKDYIFKNDCPNLSMDISNLNIIDASKVTVLCSTYHWAKYPNGKINWKTSSPELKELIHPLNLGNINFINE